MKTRVDVIAAPSFFHTFLFLFTIAVFTALFMRIQVETTIFPSTSAASQAFASRVQMFRGLVKLPLLVFAPARDEGPAPVPDEEAGMSPKALMDRWQPIIAEASRRFSVPEKWIRAVIRVESGGRTTLFGRPITSGAGAMGVMQLMRDTYDDMRARYGLGSDPYNARDNILAGTAYLRELYKKYGYPHLFAAYNAGPGRLEQHLQKGVSLPAETRAYLRLATDGAFAGTKLAAVKPLKGGAKPKRSVRVAAVYQPAS